MGYMGLDSYTDSDYAADLAATVHAAMVKVLAEGLEEEANGFNTNGVVNVALFFEKFIIPIDNEEDYTHFTSDFFDLAEKTFVGLEEEIRLWEEDEVEDHDNREMHLKAYKRMKRRLKHWIKDHRG